MDHPNRRSGPLTRCTALLGAFVLSGCYTYVPVSSAPPGSEVRVLLPVETRRAGGVVTRETMTVEGRLIAWDDTVRVATASTQQIGNFREIRQVDTLQVPALDLDGVELKEFSPGRTVGLTAVILGGAALAVAGITQVVGGSEEGGGNGNGTAAAITVGGVLKLLRALGGGD